MVMATKLIYHISSRTETEKTCKKNSSVQHTFPRHVRSLPPCIFFRVIDSHLISTPLNSSLQCDAEWLGTCGIGILGLRFLVESVERRVSFLPPCHRVPEDVFGRLDAIGLWLDLDELALGHLNAGDLVWLQTLVVCNEAAQYGGLANDQDVVSRSLELKDDRLQSYLITSESVS